ncbi:peptidoglycan-binding domain-containing protein [Azospirillum picis]|uniref:Peptidoglycan hydrolase-like protein with peptidoglycan-binding domain n=1 Tax=Azospirillum picis TaxID=488438 RepID=A0ABU0MNV6_9PROT|nr:peptidoglycan-binding domain-containing protein [Azospirillum picis]MBP2301255.1 peptidoglycan hydrolase-like protein with peptidoglycan-binding domain [Azospirillum picis]MDQ0535086.1 peptidoglycan hydrolase-like protein with peptidoglycan-binding domain [Azospirillum picis]
MSGIARRMQGGAAVAVVIASALALGTPATARAEPGAADIQWAQIILKEKGFDIGGRPKGQMTPETRAALSAYQKSVGLPATGNLDQATVGKMMAEREKKATPTMGSLSKSQVGQTHRDKEVAPRAAPTGRVSAGNETVGGMAQFGGAPVSSSSSSSSSSASSSASRTEPAAPAARPAPSAVASSAAPAAGTGAAPAAHTAADGPVPQAAPRGAVSATTPDGRPAVVEEAPAIGSGTPIWQSNAARYGVAGLVAATLGGIGFAWWRSGRGADPLRGAPAGDDRPRDTRVEPSFGGPRRREELTTGPRLTADARRR